MKWWSRRRSFFRFFFLQYPYLANKFLVILKTYFWSVNSKDQGTTVFIAFLFGSLKVPGNRLHCGREMANSSQVPLYTGQIHPWFGGGMTGFQVPGSQTVPVRNNSHPQSQKRIKKKDVILCTAHSAAPLKLQNTHYCCKRPGRGDAGTRRS